MSEKFDVENRFFQNYFLSRKTICAKIKISTYYFMRKRTEKYFSPLFPNR